MEKLSPLWHKASETPNPDKYFYLFMYHPGHKYYSCSIMKYIGESGAPAWGKKDDTGESLPVAWIYCDDLMDAIGFPGIDFILDAEREAVWWNPEKMGSKTVKYKQRRMEQCEILKRIWEKYDMERAKALSAKELTDELVTMDNRLTKAYVGEQMKRFKKRY